MKKILITALIVGGLASGAWAQGVVTFKNTGTGANGSIAFGSANVTLDDGLGNLSNLAGAGYSAGLWLSSSDSASDPLGVVNFGSGAFAGTFVAQTFAVPGIAAGGTANLVVRAWDNQGGTVTSWSAALTRGESNPFNVVLGNPIDAQTYPILVGMNAFSITVVPEPSVIALALLGAGALFFRRKKA